MDPPPHLPLLRIYTSTRSFLYPLPGGTIEIATQIASYIAWNIVILIAHGKLDMIS